MTGRPAAGAAAILSTEQKVESMMAAIKENCDIDSRQVLGLATPKMAFYDQVKEFMHECGRL